MDLLLDGIFWFGIMIAAYFGCIVLSRLLGIDQQSNQAQQAFQLHQYLQEMRENPPNMHLHLKINMADPFGDDDDSGDDDDFPFFDPPNDPGLKAMLERGRVYENN